MRPDIECEAEANRDVLPVTKINKRIEIIAANNRELKESGFGSLETAQGICKILKCRYQHVRFSEIQNEQDLKSVSDRTPDLVVLCVKYFVRPEDGSQIWLSEYFSNCEIAHTGTMRAGLEFDSNKGKAKNVLLNKGVATAKFFLAHPDLFDSEQRLPLPLPLFVKPLDAANGNGVDEHSLVHDFESYQLKVQRIYDAFGVSALVEEVLPGREFTVAVLESSSCGPRLIMPVEIIVPVNEKGDRVLGCIEKLSNCEQLLAVAEPEATNIAALADQAFTLLGVRDFGRIDIKMDSAGKPHFLEANLVPGMTPETSYFPRACAVNKSLSYETVVLKIIELALGRNVLAATV